MKDRVINWLKGLAINNHKKIQELDISDDNKDYYTKKAEELVDRILTNFKDFQIKTIDSFLTSIFKASAIDFGYPQDFELTLNNNDYMNLAFDAYLNELTDNDLDFFEVINFINENEPNFSFLPHEKILGNIKALYVKERQHSIGFINQKRESEWNTVVREISAIATEIKNFIENNKIKLNGNCSLKNMLTDIENNDFYTFFTRGDSKGPVLKADEKKPWANSLEDLWQKLNKKKLGAMELYSERYYYPYISVLRAFEKKVEEIKQKQEIVFIEDISSVIIKNIDAMSIPDVYIRLGGRLYHYFIDEFQDTSQVQWENIKNLIEESISQGGSLFIVGDTKQAIYGFRDTDYSIMRDLTELENGIPKNNPFCSISSENYHIKNLDKNFRSGENILLYAKAVFDFAKSEYVNYSESGLFDWLVESDNQLKEKGYVNAKIVVKDKELEENQPEKSHLLQIIDDLKRRNFSFSDIAILAQKNSQIVEISTWLSEAGFPFLSYSSLDIRKRNVINELNCLLKFLDSPKDNQSFAFFLLGEIFSSLKLNLNVEEFILLNKENEYLYKSFQKQYQGCWDQYFDKPFRYVGYLPIYELLCFVIKTFKVNENFADESGAIAKALEIVKDLESKGKNSLKEYLDFLKSKEDDEYESAKVFELPTPKSTDAIKLMTVHKAKGLGFPVVIYFLYPDYSKSESLKIAELKDGLKVLKINSGLKKGNLEHIYNQINTKSKINDLNSLYVGLTRAKEELYIIGVADKDKEGNVKKVFPLDLIIEKEMGAKSIKEGQINIIKINEGLEIRLNKSLNILSTSVDKIAFVEKRRGEFIHLILSKILDIAKLCEEDIVTIIKDCKLYFPEFHIDDIASQIISFVFSENIKPFFESSGEEVFVEKSFVDAEGKTIRVDRLILKEDTVIVIDFKTGEMEEKYLTQLVRYGEILKEIYERKVCCYILYFDKKDAEKVYEC